MNKRRRIVTRRHHQPNRMICPFVLVNLNQPLAQGMNGYPNDGVGLGIELRPTTQRFHRDRIFLDLVRPTMKVFFAHIPKHSRQIL